MIRCCLAVAFPRRDFWSLLSNAWSSLGGRLSCIFQPQLDVVEQAQVQSFAEINPGALRGRELGVKAVKLDVLG